MDSPKEHLASTCSQSNKESSLPVHSKAISFGPDCLIIFGAACICVYKTSITHINMCMQNRRWRIHGQVYVLLQRGYWTP